MNHRLIEALMAGLAPVVRDYVASCVDKACAPLNARIAELEARPLPKNGKDADITEAVEHCMKALPPPPKDGRDGLDGKDADPEMVQKFVAEEVARCVGALPPPRDGKDGERGEAGKPGEPGKDGKDADPVLINQLVEAAVAEIPKPKDGVGALATVIDRDGCLMLTLTDGSTKNLGCVVGRDVDPELVAAMIKAEVAKIPVPKDGKDGKDGRDGKDGAGFDQLSFDYDGDRTLTLAFALGDETKEIRYAMPVTIYRGVWRPGLYQKGDQVTLGGSCFIAQCDTEAKPETSKDWTLSTKRGGNGPSAFDAAKRAGFKGTEADWLASLKGERGKPGEPGRDLTQMTLTGDKY